MEEWLWLPNKDLEDYTPEERKEYEANLAQINYINFWVAMGVLVLCGALIATM